MPSGPKKRKASKRKHHKMGGDDHHRQQDSPTSPNPSSLLPLIEPHGNGWEDRSIDSIGSDDLGSGWEKRPVVVEDECEETFETPRFQPETPRFPPVTPYYSMESMKMGRIDEIVENSTGLDLEIPSNDVESPKEMKLEESENSNASEDAEGLKETKLDESVGVTEKELVAVVDEERTPNASTLPVDVFSSNEKEVKVVPWSDEEIPAVNGAVNGDVEVIPSEKRGDGIVESESREGEGLDEATVDNLGTEKEQPIPVTENSNYVVESVRETLPQIDVDLINTKLDKTVEKSSPTVESSYLITEEAIQGSKAPHESLESVVGASPVLPRVRVKEATSCSLDAEKNNIAQRKEVARDPAVVHCATIWNCCGLLEVFSSSDR